METFSYLTEDGQTKWGFKIFEDDKKESVTYSSSGFYTEEEAREAMLNAVEWLEGSS